MCVCVCARACVCVCVCVCVCSCSSCALLLEAFVCGAAIVEFTLYFADANCHWAVAGYVGEPELDDAEVEALQDDH